MRHESEEIKSETAGILRDLEKLREFRGEPSDFWPGFMQGAARLTGTESGILLVRTEGEDGWKILYLWPPENQSVIKSPDILSEIEAAADIAAGENFSTKQIKKYFLFGIRLELGDRSRVGVAVFLTGRNAFGGSEETIVRLSLISDIPKIYQMNREAEKSKSDVVRFAETLDFMTTLNETKRYLAGAMTLCNEIASRFGCSRASLGWLEKGYVRVQAISHME
ncbi:MAG: hypothetical protein JRJ23_05150, partial [Deltaproteobacteria bacterium]|nr:hypothetical protein [Deltaproteobacteria bacterium]